MAKYSELKRILKSHRLRITNCRMDVLRFFVVSRQALSMKDLEEEFGEYDKVTLYRTLHSFTEHGVLHKIPDDTGVVSYGVCHDTCGVDGHYHDHVHFKCRSCGAIECLDKDLPSISVPGYEIQEASMILQGICRVCNPN
ncbi:MAG: transcriptional repressor [Bacteroidota bacterium]